MPKTFFFIAFLIIGFHHTAQANEPVAIEFHGVSLTLPPNSRIISRENGAGYEGAPYEHISIETSETLPDVMSFFTKQLLPSQGWIKTMGAWHLNRLGVMVQNSTSTHAVQIRLSYSGTPPPCPPCRKNQKNLPGCSCP